MSGTSFMRIKKLKGSGIIKAAARHNKREIQAEIGASGSIDPARFGMNETLMGPSTAEDVAKVATVMMNTANVQKPRKDAVLALEIVFSLPPNHRLEDRAYFNACATWAGSYFGGANNILSADIHRDEAAPHCHVLLLPMVDGRMIGNKLVGHKPKLLAMQKDFHDAVASRYGLRKAPSRLTGTAKQAAASMVLARLRETSDGALHSLVWATLRDVIENSPEQFLQALGLDIPVAKRPGRTMSQIFTSKGKGPSREVLSNSRDSNDIAFVSGIEEARPNAIAFENSSTDKDQRLCPVAFTQNPPSLPRTQPAHTEPLTVDCDALDGSRPSDPAAPLETHEPALSVEAKPGHSAVSVQYGSAIDRVQTPPKPKRITKASLCLRPSSPEVDAQSLAYIRKNHGPAGVKIWWDAQQDGVDL